MMSQHSIVWLWFDGIVIYHFMSSVFILLDLIIVYLEK